MSISFVTSSSQGEVCRLPDRVKVATPEFGIDGISFVDMGFRSEGWSSYSITGLEVVAWNMSSGVVYQSHSSCASPDGTSRGIALRGPQLEGRATWTGAYSGRVLTLSPVAIERIYGQPIGRTGLQHAKCMITQSRSVNHLMSAMSMVFDEARLPDPLLVDSICLAVLRAMVEPEASGQGQMGHLSTRQADQVRGYIRANLPDVITVTAMAELVGLSEGYFIKVFRKTFGLTPYQFIMRERVQAAQDLIKSSDLPLTKVALKTGFSSAGNMSRTFRHLTGQTPSGRKGSTRT